MFPRRSLSHEGGGVSSSCPRATAANDSLIADLQNAIAQIEACAAASSGFHREAQQAAQTSSSTNASIARYLAGHGYGDVS
ncbi:MAG: hypothetical protein QM302_06150 [Acidobacteriota bacterium]|nr:hypothetical protein [Acidobacteriota bacterium]